LGRRGGSACLRKDGSAKRAPLTQARHHDRIDAEAVQDAITAMDPAKEGGGETLAETEADQIRRVLAATGGNKSRAAQILGIERKTLYRKLEKMKL